MLKALGRCNSNIDKSDAVTECRNKSYCLILAMTLTVPESPISVCVDLESSK